MYCLFFNKQMIDQSAIFIFRLSRLFCRCLLFRCRFFCCRFTFRIGLVSFGYRISRGCRIITIYWCLRLSPCRRVILICCIIRIRYRIHAAISIILTVCCGCPVVCNRIICSRSYDRFLICPIPFFRKCTEACRGTHQDSKRKQPCYKFLAFPFLHNVHLIFYVFVQASFILYINPPLLSRQKFPIVRQNPLL